MREQHLLVEGVHKTISVLDYNGNEIADVFLSSNKEIPWSDKLGAYTLSNQQFEELIVLTDREQEIQDRLKMLRSYLVPSVWASFIEDLDEICDEATTEQNQVVALTLIQEAEEEHRIHIVSNQAQCLSCGDSIFSMHRHDFVTCACGAISVDGGQAYLRRIGDLNNFKELSISLPNGLVRAIQKNLSDSISTGRNPLGLTYAALRAIRDAGYTVTKELS